jgi:hypothetical protein
MSRPRPLLALTIAATLAALLLTACGGGEEDTTATSSSSGGQAAKEAKEERTSTAPLPSPQPGAKAAAPGVPTSKQGDNSIQTYGLEAESEERAEATELVHAYLDARAVKDWAKVCSLLAAKPRAEQRRLAKGASCAEAMGVLATGASSAILAEEAEIQVLSFRVGAKYAFLIYRRPDGVYATALNEEGGAWKVVSVGPAAVG